MKKKLAGILAVLMVLTMGTTVFAAPSADKDSDLKKEAAALVTTVESGSSDVAITTNAVATSDLTAAYDYVAQKVGKETGFTVLAAVDLSSAAALPSGGVQVTFHVSGLSQGTGNVRIYHKTASGWEIKTPFVGNGYVTASFDSLSPFFVVKYDSAPSDDGSVDSSTVINNYYTTNNTYNNTTSDSHNSTTSDSHATSNMYNNTNSNNATTSNATNSNNATTSNATNSNNTTSSTTNNNAATTKKSTASKSDSTTKKNTKKSSKKTSKKDTSKTSVSQSESVKVDNSSKNTQTVTVSVDGSGSGSAKAGASTSTTSPKTGAEVPVLPIIAVFAVMGIAVCGKKARNL